METIAQIPLVPAALGTLLAYGLGMVWFSPLMFGAGWARGSHGIQPPERPPVAAMLTMFLGVAALAAALGAATAAGGIALALSVLVALVLWIAALDLFSQKSVAASLIDAGYAGASGLIMLVVPALI